MNQSKEQPRLSELHIIRDDRFKDSCQKAKNLYNQMLYYWRQSVFGKIQPFSEYELRNLMQEFNEENFNTAMKDEEGWIPTTFCGLDYKKSYTVEQFYKYFKENSLLSSEQNVNKFEK